MLLIRSDDLIGQMFNSLVFDRSSFFNEWYFFVSIDNILLSYDNYIYSIGSIVLYAWNIDPIKDEGFIVDIVSS